ncbi:MAG: proton-conducting transporter membrane subunit, partial [Gammaproteobacteria bacterium]
MIGSLLPLELFPALILIIGGLLVPLVPEGFRRAFIVAVPIVGALHFLSYPLGNYGSIELFDYTLTIMRLDALSRIFGLVFFLATFVNVIYAWHVRDTVQQVASLVYPGAALGGIFAGDFITLFVFWEIAAISSVFLIWARGTERAYKAGMRYIVIQVGSGVLLLAGLVLYAQDTGSIAFEHMELGTLPVLLIFLAFGIKSAFPLLHNWVQDSYPESTVTGTIMLSIFTTKLAVYALVRGFAGTEQLIYIGVVMTLFPIFFAVIEDNLRRVLTYSINNQVGFMVVAIGVGTPLALNGAVGYAFCNIIFES